MMSDHIGFYYRRGLDGSLYPSHREEEGKVDGQSLSFNVAGQLRRRRTPYRLKNNVRHLCVWISLKKSYYREIIVITILGVKTWT